MAITNGSQVKFVTVANMSGYNDITPKDPSTIYFVRGANKIFVDGIAYGVNDSDLVNYLKKDGTSEMTGTLFLNGNVLNFIGDAYGNNPSIVATNNGETITITFEADPYISFSKGEIAFNEGVGGLGKIKGVDSPAQDNDVANKKYVDDVVNNEVVLKKGQANGFASLDSAGKVPQAQLPSYVDDVLEYDAQANFPSTGEDGKIYVAKDTNKTYRWTGSAYIEISASLALGETSSTAYRGDRGKVAYEHTSSTSNPHSVTKSQVGLGSVENYAVANQAEAEAGSSTTKYMTPLRVKQAIESFANKTVWTVVS